MRSHPRGETLRAPTQRSPQSVSIAGTVTANSSLPRRQRTGNLPISSASGSQLFARGSTRISANSASVFSLLNAANATFALKAAVPPFGPSLVNAPFSGDTVADESRDFSDPPVPFPGTTSGKPRSLEPSYRITGPASSSAGPCVSARCCAPLTERVQQLPPSKAPSPIRFARPTPATSP